MEKTIKTKSDIKLMLAELKEELNYFSNWETIEKFNKVISEWGFNPEDFKN